MNEKCNCAAHEKLDTLTISVTVLRPNEIEVTIHHGRGNVTQSEPVKKGTTSSLAFGRKYDDLVVLGPGKHVICQCRAIAPKDAAFRRGE